MLRRSAWLLLVAVIVSTQVFTIGCDTRCGRAAIRSLSAGGVCGACQRRGSGSEAAMMPAMGKMCKDLLCKDDSASITNVYAASPATIASQPAMAQTPAWMTRPAMRPLDGRLRRSSTENRMPDPVPTNLKI